MEDIFLSNVCDSEYFIARISLTAARHSVTTLKILFSGGSPTFRKTLNENYNNFRP